MGNTDMRLLLASATANNRQAGLSSLSARFSVVRIKNYAMVMATPMN